MSLLNLKGLIANFIKLLFRPLLHIIYFLSGFFPRSNDIWVFGSASGQRFGDNPKWFYYYCNWRSRTFLTESKKYIWISKNNEIVNELKKDGYLAYYYYSYKGIYYCLRAGVYIFDNGIQDISYVLSRKTKSVNLWHGSPLKKIIWDALSNSLGKNRSYLKKKGTFLQMLFYKFMHPFYYHKANIMLAASDCVKERMETAFFIEKNSIKIKGYPRNDIFFDLDYINDYLNYEAQYKLILRLKMDSSSKIIVYLPTFRDSNLSKDHLDLLDLDKLESFLSKYNYYLVYKGHFSSKNIKKEKQDKKKYKHLIYLDPIIDIYPILKISDLLITDYSSVYFDYMLMNKPIVFFPYDLNEYITEDRELYVDYEKETPGPKATNIDELIYEITEVLQNHCFIKSEHYHHIKRKYNFNTSGSFSENVYFEIIKLL